MRSAFTLIELLVVVSIIAILAAILLPTVSLIREAARRTQCASNLRQVGAAMLTYGQDQDGCLPLFYEGGKKQSSIFFYGKTNNVLGPGRLWEADLLTDAPKVWYCPSYKDDSERMFNTALNVWPPAPDGKGHRASYNFRPIADVNGATMTNLAATAMRLYTRKIIATDCNDKLVRFDDHHKNAHNAVAGDGSVRPVGLGKVITWYVGWPAPTSQNTSNNGFVDNLWNIGLDGAL